MNHAQFWGGAAAPYEIEQSLRFDRSSYLSRTFTTGNARVWSLSVWVKRAGGIGDNDRDIFGAYTSGNPRIGGVECGSGGGDADLFGVDQGGSASNGNYYVNGRRRDPSAWYHLVVSVNYNTPSAKIWVNGVLQSQERNSLAAADGLINTAIPHEIGGRVTGASTSNRWDGYMAEFHFLDTDSQLSDPNDFGEFDDNGVWRPIEYTGSYGDNGFYLKFDPSATNGIGHDHSGNGNNFTANNFTTSGTGTDVMDDTPTTNWCTLNPLKKGANVDLSDGNLVATMTSTNVRWNGTIAMPPGSGKYYAEMTVTQTNNYGSIGLSSIDDPASGETSGYAGFNGNYKSSAYGSSYGTGDVIGIAYDAVNGAVYFSKNGTWQNSGDPTSGSSATGAAESGLTGTYVFGGGIYGGTTGIYTLNFGQRDFAYTPPTGYSGLNTANLPAPDIADGSDNFQTILDSGANILSSAQSAFSSGLWWIKDRANSNKHQIFDTVTTSSSVLLCPGTGRAAYSAPSGNSVAWAWSGPSSGTTDTSGSIETTVYANTDAGFSIATWSGTGVNATVGHGLDFAPEFVGVSWSDTSSAQMQIGSDGLTSWSNYLELDASSAQGSSSTRWQNTAPTDTVVSVGTACNYSGQTMYMYSWHSVPGYSKIGVYAGGYTSYEPFIYTGFKPKWLLIKNAERSSTNWVLIDTSRDTYNAAGFPLKADGQAGESAYSEKLDILSNGFKLRTTELSYNGPDDAPGLIYMAFAEHPFGGSGVSPATAR